MTNRSSRDILAALAARREQLRDEHAEELMGIAVHYDREEARQWRPGDPLYNRGTTCTVRYMIEMPGDETAYRPDWARWTGEERWCAFCEVAWSRTANCFICGRFGRDVFNYPGAETGTPTVHTTRRGRRGWR